ncbi:MAG: arylesterase [Saprospiraceae bacterium]|nr:arylesterase [Saprospiraceae bacterium]MDW8228277.1 arylesterase [Saprospiraceae bacterium]
MTYRIVLLLAVALLAFAHERCRNAAPSSPAAETGAAADTAQARRVILFFGNSLTAAYGLSPEEGFVALIQQKIDSLKLPYTCVNAGNSGETTAGGRSRVAWVLSQPVDIFVLELGGNDALRGLPLDASRENLQAIIDQVRAKYPACRIVIAGMLAPPNLGPEYTQNFAQMYRDLAAANQTALIPFLLEGVGGEPALNLPDGIHPNAAGHRIVSENVWRVLYPILRESL